MTILYLHGLESKLSPAKRSILESFGTVIAPDMDYHNNQNVYDSIIELHAATNFDVVIGSSMGGFMSYYIANTVNCPALLFNPALPYRSVQQNIPELQSTAFTSLLHFALGGKDDVIKANDNLAWIASNRSLNTNYHISIHREMGHQISLDKFEIEVKEFFKQLEPRS